VASLFGTSASLNSLICRAAPCLLSVRGPTPGHLPFHLRPFCVLLRTKIPFFLTEEKTVFERLMLFCPKMVRLSQQDVKEKRLLFGTRPENGVSLHQKFFFIRDIYYLVGFSY